MSNKNRLSALVTIFPKIELTRRLLGALLEGPSFTSNAVRSDKKDAEIQMPMDPILVTSIFSMMGFRGIAATRACIMHIYSEETQLNV